MTGGDTNVDGNIVLSHGRRDMSWIGGQGWQYSEI